MYISQFITVIGQVNELQTQQIEMQRLTTDHNVTLNLI